MDLFSEAIESSELEDIPQPEPGNILLLSWQNKKAQKLANSLQYWLKNVSPEVTSDAVYWNDLNIDGLVFDVKITNDKLAHLFPGPHFIYAYIGINFEVPRDKIGDVMKLTRSVWYHKASKKLIAGCSTFGASLAMLFQAVSIARGDDILCLARQELAPLIKAMINEEKKGHGIFNRSKQHGPYTREVLSYLVIA